VVEFGLLALAVVMLFRPGFFMDMLAPEYARAPAAQVYELARSAARQRHAGVG
jgi:hypothetical protein